MCETFIRKTLFVPVLRFLVLSYFFIASNKSETSLQFDEKKTAGENKTKTEG